MPLRLESPPSNSSWRRRPHAANASHYPWLLVQQARQQQVRGVPRRQETRAALRPRVAVCIAGTTRSLVHPTIWRSIEQNVLGRSHEQPARARPGVDVFAVLSTGPEDTAHAAAERSKAFTPTSDVLAESQWREAFTWRSSRERVVPWDEAESHGELLAHALTGLRPLGIRIRTEPANISCGLPSSAQFSRWADCAELIEAHEARVTAAGGGSSSRPFRYDAMLKIRTDVVHKFPLVNGGSLTDLVRKLEARTIVSMDDLVLLIPRDHWSVLHAMRPGVGGMRCPRWCNERYRANFPDVEGYAMPTHCLMRSHFARFNVHHVDVGLMLPVELLLVDTSIRAADPTERIAKLNAPSQIVRLRPTRGVKREGSLAPARDWEGSERPILCEPLEAPEHQPCAPYWPAFRCHACGSSGAPCPPVSDVFPPHRWPSSTAVSSDAPARVCAACCLNATCSSSGCAALADVVPGDQSGNAFAARGGAIGRGSVPVQLRTGRYIACARVLRPLCEAGIALGCAKSQCKRPPKPGGVDVERSRSSLQSEPSGQRAPTGAEVDLRLIEVACALDADRKAAHDSAAVDQLLDAMLPAGEGAPPSMRSSTFFAASDRRGWSAYFVLQLFEGHIVRRLLQLAASDQKALGQYYSDPCDQGSDKYGKRSGQTWHAGVE